MKLNKLTMLLASLSMVATTSLFADKLMMATTTSTDNTGLLDYLAPKYKKDTGNTLQWVSTGTGNALKMGEKCDVDILFVHAPAAEKKFIEKGLGENRKQVMYNDFIIVGPKSDPAKVTGMKNVIESLKKIEQQKTAFFSRGDDSGTNKMEISLWKKALENAPEKQSWYFQTGQGMLRTIDMAAQKDGYTLTDRGTWIKYANQKGEKNTMKIVVEGDEVLFNQYSVITINNRCPKANIKAATSFTNWIVAPENQKFIADFKLLGQSLFIPNADK